MDGFLVVDKPPGMTSHDVVAVVRAVTGIEKVGHTGTLDPFATGVLVLALGAATRLVQFLDEREKVYDATVLLGTATDTGDPSGSVVAEAPVPALHRRQVEDTLATFLGERMQAPPRYSAVKVAGKPLYAYARKGVEMTVPARPIQVFGMELLDLEPPSLRARIRCSRGTYARVLAEEIGTALGSVGHLGALRREASGGFTLERAVSFARLSTVAAGDPDWARVLRPSRGQERVAWRARADVLDGLREHLVEPRAALAHLPLARLGADEARRFRNSGKLGRPVGEIPTLLVDGELPLGVAVPGGSAVVLGLPDGGRSLGERRGHRRP